ILLLFLFLSDPVEAAVSLVQRVGKETGNVSSTTLAFGSNNSAGNLIAVVIRSGRSGETITVKDSRSNSYRLAGSLNVTLDTPQGDPLAVYYAESISAGANTVTITQSQPASLRFEILEYSGLASSSSLDAVVSQQGASNSATSGSLTTTRNGDLLLSGMM